MPQKGLKPFLHKNGKKLVAVLVIAAILVVLLVLVPQGPEESGQCGDRVYPGDAREPGHHQCVQRIRRAERRQQPTPSRRRSRAMS